jgi:hypothetical protein
MNCARRFENHPRTLTKDLPVYSWAQTRGPDGPFVELRAWVRYSKGGEKEVPIWFSGCREEHTFSRAYAQQLKSLHNQRGDEFPNWCPPCAKDPDRIVASVMAQTQNGNGQESGSAESRKQKRLDKNLLKAVDAVASIWEHVRNYPNRSYQKRLDMITQADLARALGYKSQDEKNLINTASNYLTRCQVREMFPNSESWFRSFVETVVELIEKKISSEEIVSRLKSRLLRSLEWCEPLDGCASAPVLASVRWLVETSRRCGRSSLWLW